MLGGAKENYISDSATVTMLISLGSDLSADPIKITPFLSEDLCNYNSLAIPLSITFEGIAPDPAEEKPEEETPAEETLEEETPEGP